MKIAFLFLLIDNPNFPEIWDEYFKNNEEKYNLYIHPKYPEKQTWRVNNTIKNLKETAWGFIVESNIELMREAYQNKENIKFITISESCVPIKSFDLFYDECLSKNNVEKSWIKLLKMKKYDLNERIGQHIKKIKKNNENIKIPKVNKLIKHLARFCLSRNHVNKLLEADEEKKIKFFSTMQVGDEFYLSVLYPLNKDNYIDFEVTKDDWEYVEKQLNKIRKRIEELYIEIENIENKKMELDSKKEKILKLKEKILELKSLKNELGKNPKTIINVEEDLNNIKKSDSYFYRKFSKNSNIEEYWNEIIEKN